METAERIKGKSVKREQVSSTGRYQPTIGKKRPSGGVNELVDKKPKELGLPNIERTSPQDKRPNGQKRQGRLQAIQEPEAAEEGGIVEGSLVSTLVDLVSTHYPKSVQKVVMRNQWSPMGKGKSDEHPPYE
ncbi:hypothetical protein Taro_012807 [Colocasia esculenta]|uniref:Uncharacterized protein n=1 Tax=Colocasia esculenta TaxID=4460 RepID=A0A843UDT8_COLES|nr:hypothetical protein [Colocasia esculenta]